MDHGILRHIEIELFKGLDERPSLSGASRWCIFPKRHAAKNIAATLCALAFTALSIVAHAQESHSLAQRYSHIQMLNNAGAKLVYVGSPNAAQLSRALEYLSQSMHSISLFNSELELDSWFRGGVENRREDNLRYQADAYAKLGNQNAALDRLDQWAADSLWTNEEQWLITDKNFTQLHKNPRFKALVTRLNNLSALWNATALVRSAKRLSEAQRIAGLSLFWSAVQYNFAHFSHVPDLNWNKLYLEYLPKVIKAKTLHAYYNVLMHFAPMLHDAHTNIWPPKSIQNQFYASPPIATALIQNHVVITWVADPRLITKGVRVGDEILTVDGLAVRRYARRYVKPYVSSSTPQDMAVRLYSYQLLAGDHTKPVTLGLEDSLGNRVSVRLSREPDPSAKWKARFEFRMLPGGIAYLSLGEFADDRGAKVFRDHLSQILHAKGLILDVRSNGGGSTGNGLRILSWLTSKPIPLPRLRTLEYIPTYRAWLGPYDKWKSLALPHDTYKRSRPRHFSGPVAVLIGPRTFSAAEDFVVSFVAMKRGILVGSTTAGSSGQPLVIRLPGGGFARICTAQETFPDGRKFVDIGIAPQIKVRQTIADIRTGRDPVIATAAAALLAEKSDLVRR